MLAEDAGATSVTTAQWILTVQRETGALAIRDRAGRVLVDGILPHGGRRFTMAEALGAKKSGTWPVSILEQADQPVIKAERLGERVRLSVHATYRLPVPAALAEAAPKGAAAQPDDLLPAGEANHIASPGRPGSPGNNGGAAVASEQGLVGGYTLEIDGKGAIAVSYAYRPLAPGAIVSEAGLSMVAPAGMAEFRWVGQGPYAGYPGKDQLNEFGIYHLNRADLRFQGNRRQTELAVLSDTAGAGFALALPAADVAVERHGARTLLSHNAVIGGLGNKGTQPETVVALDKVGEISGRFLLLPLGGAWPQALQGWVGAPGAAGEVLKPFWHSYDQ